jgi:sugar/nucleoside kinase (ribokinase family)
MFREYNEIVILVIWTNSINLIFNDMMQRIKTLGSIVFLSMILIGGCGGDDDELVARVSVNGTILFDDGDDFFGDVDGDFTGNGGSDTRTFLWQNNKTTADYNADITATSEGSFRMVIKDADGATVLYKTLRGDSEPDSIDGVTSCGTSGIWSVIITLTNFHETEVSH